MTELSEDRQRMAEALRDLREQAGLSTTQLADRLGWSQSKVSKTERGVTLPPPADVDAWAIATDAPSALRSQLGSLAGDAAAEFSERRKLLAPGPRRAQQEIQRLEAAASVVRVFNTSVVPGLAQTRAYVEAMFRLGKHRTPPEHFDEQVNARLARQAALADRRKRFELMMGEAAVRRLVVAPADLRVQLERLVELSRQPNIAVGVIRFDAVEREHQYSAYSVMGDPDLDDEAIVVAGSVTRTWRIRAESEVREYIEHFAALRAAATEGEPLRAFLRELIAELPGDL